MNTPQYPKSGGQTDRRALIAMTATIDHQGDLNALIDGTHASNFFFYPNPANNVAGTYIRFDFGVDAHKLITEATLYQDVYREQGIWQWQGSDNGTDWTNIGANFTLGCPYGTTVQIQTELHGNTNRYRYYQLLGISGTTDGTSYELELDFKIDGYEVDFEDVFILPLMQITM